MREIPRLSLFAKSFIANASTLVLLLSPIELPAVYWENQVEKFFED
jgi:hypothetical protein